MNRPAAGSGQMQRPDVVLVTVDGLRTDAPASCGGRMEGLERDAFAQQIEENLIRTPLPVKRSGSASATGGGDAGRAPGSSISRSIQEGC